MTDAHECTHCDANTFYTVLVEGVAETEAFVQVFFTWADGIGEAIAKVLTVATEEECIKNPLPSEADPYDFGTLPGDVKKIGCTSVYSSGGRFFFPAGEPVFRIPSGVILSCIEGEFDSEELCAGFRGYSDGELVCIDCAVPDGKLEQVLNPLVGVLSDIRVCWVECSDEWDNAEARQFYANEALNSPELVRDFLHGEANNILFNGMVKFTVYSDEGRTNLVVDDHKIIRVLTYSKNIFEAMADKLRTLGFEPTEELKTVSHGLHHWHYSPTGALSRQDFVAHLIERGFSLWKEIPAGGE